MEYSRFRRDGNSVKGAKVFNRKSAVASVALVFACLISPNTAYASSSPTPTTTQIQKDAIATAKAAYAMAKTNARDGFDRAIADAQAIRDQAILAAGKNKTAIRIAKQNFRDFNKVIIRAYKAALKTAKANFQNALLALNEPANTN